MLGKRNLIIMILGLALLLSFPYWASPYILAFLFFLFVYISLAESYDIIGGYAGYMNLGHIVFFAIGAYTFSMLVVLGCFLPVALMAAPIASVIFAATISFPFFRLRGAFYAIATLGFVFFLQHLFLNVEEFGGTKGITIPLPAEITTIPCYYLALGTALASILTSYKLNSSSLGLALMSIRDNENIAEVFGIKTFKYKFIALILSSVYAGIAGALYSWFIGQVRPGSVFGVGITLMPITMALIGGSGHFLGPVIGAIFLKIIEELIWSISPYFHLATYGIMLILVGLFMPGGLIRLREIEIKKWWKMECRTHESTT